MRLTQAGHILRGTSNNSNSTDLSCFPVHIFIWTCSMYFPAGKTRRTSVSSHLPPPSLVCSISLNYALSMQPCINSDGSVARGLFHQSGWEGNSIHRGHWKRANELASLCIGWVYSDQQIDLVWRSRMTSSNSVSHWCHQSNCYVFWFSHLLSTSQYPDYHQCISRHVAESIGN